ncbi:venom allergen 5.02 [Ceratitis capitata]|uniref:venom allergen 5.02 n=1 Tax=Ceratitis capitata TaxID=7213 RepID=UPI000A122632|nr:venom allergen 5.02 [Ceratitis capitata]
MYIKFYYNTIAKPRSVSSYGMLYKLTALTLFLAYLVISAQPAFGFASKNFCELNCGNRSHTLCGTANNIACSYRRNRVFDNKELRDMGLRDQLIIAHNGLRQRIAQRMHVGNMVLVKWSEQLTQMATNWAQLCRPYVDDECTHMSKQLNLRTLMNITNGDQVEGMYVAMNRFCINALYLPRELIEMAFHFWYFEKDYMNEPTFKAYEELLLGFLSGDNNFTHLAYPLVRRFGCSVASYDNVFCIFCFYDPYHRHSKGIVYIHGKQTAHCPPSHPIADLVFPSLCTRNLFIDADLLNQVSRESEISASFVIFILLRFVFLGD